MAKLTELLNAHHDKLNEHTAQLKQIEAQLAALDATVGRLGEQLDKGEQTEESGVLRNWLTQLRELM